MPNSWLVSNLSYADTIKLASSELVESFQRDPRRGEARFWPGNPGVLKHLKDNLPEGCTIEGEELQAKVASPRMPAVVHRMGMDIAED